MPRAQLSEFPKEGFRLPLAAFFLKPTSKLKLNRAGLVDECACVRMGSLSCRIITFSSSISPSPCQQPRIIKRQKHLLHVLWLILTHPEPPTFEFNVEGGNFCSLLAPKDFIHNQGRRQSSESFQHARHLLAYLIGFPASMFAPLPC
jgi:hypothetical protein